MTSTRAPESAARYTTSSEVSRMEVGTGMAPRFMAPRKTTGYSRQLARRISTRSPAPTPRSRRSCAKRLVSAASSAKVAWRTPVRSSSTTTAVRSSTGAPRCASVHATPMLKCSGMFQRHGGKSRTAVRVPVRAGYCQTAARRQRNAGITFSAKRRAGSRVSRPKNSITKSVQPRARCRSIRSMTRSGVPQMPCASRPAPMCPP